MVADAGVLAVLERRRPVALGPRRRLRAEVELSVPPPDSSFQFSHVRSIGLPSSCSDFTYSVVAEAFGASITSCLRTRERDRRLREQRAADGQAAAPGITG